VSEENVALVRRGYEMYAAGDLEGVAALIASDAELADAGGLGITGTASGTRHGPSGFLRSSGEAHDAFEGYTVTPEDFSAIGNAVLVRVRLTGTGRSSGVPLDALVYHLWKLRDGKVVRSEVFMTEAEALEAVGLSEQAMSQVDPELRTVAEASYRALNSGDLDAYLAVCAEDVEFTSLLAEAEARTFRGHDGVRAWWNTVLGKFDDVQWELLDVRASGDRGVAHFRIAGTLNGVPLQQSVWQAITLRRGKLSWWVPYRTEREALKAVGLAE
jgi:uncharacterized protein